MKYSPLFAGADRSGSLRRRFLVGAAAALSCAIAAPQIPVACAAERTETIGVIGFLSGPALLWGLDQKQAIETWANEVNGRGGLKVGGDTVKFKVESYDELTSVQGGVAAMQKAVFKDGAKIVFGPILTPGVIAVSSVVNENKVLNLSPATAAEVRSPKNPYQFVFYQGAYEKAYVVAKFLDKLHPEVKRIVFVVPTEGTQGEIDFVNKLAPTDDRKIVEVVRYDQGTSDFYPLLQRILADHPDLILMASNPPAEIYAMTKQARELGYKGLMGATAGGIDMGAFWDVAGQPAAGFFGTTLPSGSFVPSSYEEFTAAFLKTYGHYDTWAGAVYVMCQVLEQAILAAGSTDPDAIKQVLQSGRPFDTAIGKVSFGVKALYGRDAQMLFDIGVGVLAQGQDGKGVEKVVATVRPEY
jgi:branched-chain amino acid transport system substrate-binding protein